MTMKLTGTDGQDNVFSQADALTKKNVDAIAGVLLVVADHIIFSSGQ